MSATRADHTFAQAFRRYLAPDLLILDDFGLHRLTPQQSEDLYDLIVDTRSDTRPVDSLISDSSVVVESVLATHSR